MAFSSRYRCAVLKRLLRLLSVLALVAFCLLLLAPFTDTGSRLLLQSMARTDVLDLDYTRGSLFGHLEVAQVRLSLENLSLQLSGLKSELTPACLLKSRLCWQRLQADTVELNLLPGDAEAPEEEPDETLIELPLAITIDDLALGALTVRWPGGHWESDLRGALALEGARVELRDLASTRALLSLAGEAQQGTAPGAAVTPKPTPAPATTGVAASTDRIALPRVFLALALVVENLKLHTLEVVLPEQELNFHDLRLVGQWERYALELETLQLAHQDWGRVSILGDLAFVDDWPLSLRAEVVLAGSPYPDPLQGRALDLAVSGSAGALAIALDVAGTETIALRGDLDALDPQLPFLVQADARWSDALGLERWVSMPDSMSDVELYAPLQLRAEGNLERQQFELEASATGLGYQNMQLLLRGAQSLGELRVDQLEVKDGADNQLALQGTAVFMGEPSWDLAIDSSGLDLPRYPGVPVGRLIGGLTTRGSLAGGHWQVAVRDADVRGEVAGYPAEIRGGAELAQDSLITAADLRATINGAELHLQAPVGPRRSGLADGAADVAGVDDALLQLTVADLGRWSSDGRGELALQARLSGDGESLSVDGTSSDLRWAQWQIPAAQVKASYALKEQILNDLDLRIEKLDSTQFQLADVRLQGGGKAKDQRFVWSSRGDIEGELVLAGVFTDTGWQGELASTVLKTPLGNWTLAESVAMQWQAQREVLVIDKHCWLQERSNLCAEQLSLGETGVAAMTLRGPLDFAAHLLPEDLALAATIDVSAQANWSGEEGLRASGKAVSPGGSLRREFPEQPVTILQWEPSELAFDWRNGALQLDTRLAMLGGQASMVLELPDDPDQALSGKMKLRALQLADLEPLIPDLESLQGTLSGELALSGNVQAPLLDGVLELAEVGVRSVHNPTELEALTLQIRFIGSTASLRGEGLLGGGPVDFSGQLAWQDEPRLALTITGTGQSLLRPPSLQMKVSEQLELVATPQLLRITGAIEVLDGRFEFEELPPGSVGLSDDVVVIDYRADAVDKGPPMDIELDINVNIDERFRIAGSKLNANVGGMLSLIQRPRLPLELFGNLNVLGGELEIFGQRLLVRRGTVSFTGPPESPELNLRAERSITADNVTAGVSVRGPADALQIEIYSNPTMPQTEALSYLSRGRGLDSGAGGGVDAAAVAVSLGMGAINRSRVIDGLERLPGVSSVEFGTGQVDTETTATVSGYLGERIYLSYGIGLNEPVSVLTGRLYLQTRLWLEMVSALENSLDIYYSFDID